MFWLVLGGTGFAFAHRYRSVIDERMIFEFRRLLARLRQPPTPDENLALTGRLISSLQAGISLDAALEGLAGELAGAARVRLRAILDGRESDDFLSAFLVSALATGVPALPALQNIEKALRTRRRLQLKAEAASANCRAQAEVLSWLPWLLAGAIAALDFEWFRGAAGFALSWFLWAIAVLLTGFGKRWIRWAVARALRARDSTEALEEEILPDLVLRVIAEISQGRDVETAFERSLRAMNDPVLTRAVTSERGAKISRLCSTLRHSARTGAPVREELNAFLQDLQTELECRWEERVQRLPIALLGPLFGCFFPSSLLVLAGLLAPLLRAGL